MLCPIMNSQETAICFFLINLTISSQISSLQSNIYIQGRVGVDGKVCHGRVGGDGKVWESTLGLLINICHRALCQPCLAPKIAQSWLKTVELN